jgi:pilus assembly protein CpaE
MGSEIKALVALESGVQLASLQDVIPRGNGIEVIEYVEGLQPGVPAVSESPADLVVVACSAGCEDAAAMIQDAVKQRPDRPVVVLQVDQADSNGFMQDVFAAGADDIVGLPETPERIRHALYKAIARKRGATLAKGALLAPLICVLGPKGGTGKTVTVCNLGVSLAEAGRRTVVVDLDLHFGDVGLGLRLTPERTIYDLARSGGTLDEEKVADYLTPHESGLRVLLAPTRPDHAGAVSVTFISEVLAVLRATNGFVIVDTPAGFPSEVIATIDSSTEVVVVGMLDAFSLKDTKLGLETLDLMGYDRNSIRLVLNRADTHVGIAENDVKAILGRTPDVLVPSERDIPRSVTQGTPIITMHAGSAAAKAFRSLASLYLNPPSAVKVAAPLPKQPRRVSLLRRA